MSLLPSSPEVSVEDDPRVVGLDSDEADALMRALSSDTAREMLSALHGEPLPPSKLADEVDTTLQNAQYHLERLSDAGAIEVVGTAYSEKGREMDVYAPADKPLVIFAGRDDQASGIRSALRRLVGGLAALLFGAVAVQEVFGRSISRLASPLFGTGTGSGGDGADGGAAATATSTPTARPEDTPSGTPPPETSGGGDDVGIFDTGNQSTTATETVAGGGDGGAGGATAEPATTPQPTAEPTPMDTATPAPEATSTATEMAADGGATGATPTPTPVNETATETARLATEAAAGGDAALGLPPGLVFFLGGAVVLGVAVAITYR